MAIYGLIPPEEGEVVYIVHNHAQKLGYLPYTAGIQLQPAAPHTVLGTTRRSYHNLSHF